MQKLIKNNWYFRMLHKFENNNKIKPRLIASLAFDGPSNVHSIAHSAVYAVILPNSKRTRCIHIAHKRTRLRPHIERVFNGSIESHSECIRASATRIKLFDLFEANSNRFQIETQTKWPNRLLQLMYMLIPQRMSCGCRCRQFFGLCFNLKSVRIRFEPIG